MAIKTKHRQKTNQKKQSSACICDLLSFETINKRTKTAKKIKKTRSVTDINIT